MSAEISLFRTTAVCGVCFFLPDRPRLWGNTGAVRKFFCISILTAADSNGSLTATALLFSF